jgi:hypothetical protein
MAALSSGVLVCMYVCMHVWRYEGWAAIRSLHCDHQWSIVVFLLHRVTFWTPNNRVWPFCSGYGLLYCHQVCPTAHFVGILSPPVHLPAHCIYPIKQCAKVYKKASIVIMTLAHLVPFLPCTWDPSPRSTARNRVHSSSKWAAPLVRTALSVAAIWCPIAVYERYFIQLFCAQSKVENGLLQSTVNWEH